MKKRVYLPLLGILLLGSLMQKTALAMEVNGVNSTTFEASTVEVGTTSQELEENSDALTTEVVSQPSVESPQSETSQSEQEARVEGIIQTDDQILVRDTSLNPYRKIVRLESFFEAGPLLGTGVMIGPDLLLTAAHNVYSVQHGKWTQDVIVTPAQNGDSEPYGSYLASRIYILKAYQNEVTGTSNSYDMALIKLVEPVNSQVGYLTVTNQKSQGDRIQIAGYPVSTFEKIGFMYSMLGEISTINGNLISYQIDTESGQSGSPVLNQNNEIIAIHTLGFIDNNAQYTHNSARLILQDSLDMIAFAKGETKSSDVVASHWMVELPVYRFYHPGVKRHHYTQDPVEIAHLKKIGWSYEGENFRTTDNGEPVYRLYSSSTKEHLYTRSKQERNILVERGWNYEDISWYSQGETPVYRLYHSGLKVHLFTSDENEKNTLMKRGWNYEDIGWYAL